MRSTTRQMSERKSKETGQIAGTPSNIHLQHCRGFQGDPVCPGKGQARSPHQDIFGLVSQPQAGFRLMGAPDIPPEPSLTTHSGS